MYHGYAEKLLGLRFVDITMGHLTCFFRGAWPSFKDSTCCPYYLGMLGFNCPCTCQLFSI